MALRHSTTRFALSAAMVGVVGGLLAATIYWTLFDPRWIVFLGGVLFAALLSLASRASRAEWRLARRARQLERLRSRAGALQAAEEWLHAIAELQYAPILIVDREQVCRFHNRAAADKAGGREAPLEGRALRELLGEALHVVMQPHLAKRETATYEVAWGEARYMVRQAPCGEALCLLFAPLPAPARAPAAALAAARQPAELSVRGEHGETLYLRAIAKELSGWDDPCAKLVCALEEDKFLLYEQRIVPLAPGAEDPLAYEILLRLQEEEQHLLPPGGFLPEADRFGLMEELDRWVVAHVLAACARRKRLEREWQPPLYCVNLSDASLKSAAFGRFVAGELEASGVDPRVLAFELAEHDVLSLPAEVSRLAAELRPRGCRFTVDSFGSVKGSFGLLKDNVFSFIKIDGVVVQNILRDPAQLARLRAIHSVCCKTGMRSIAEFVEDEATLAALRAIGVHYVQGFGVERPQPMETLCR